MESALGIDIGGGTIRCAVVEAGGRILAQRKAATPPGGEPAALIDTIRRLCSELCERNRPTVATAGVGMPGFRDPVSGVMQRAVNLPQFEGINTGERIGTALGRPVRIDTDANTAGYAQWRALAAIAPAAESRHPGRFVYVAVGTGVGASVIVDGRVLRHTRGGAGHFGHLIVDTAADAPQCKCGVRGCLEAVLRTAVADQSTMARALATGLVQIAHVYAPDTIALGGGVVEHNRGLVELVRSALDGLRGSLVPTDLQVIAAPLASDDAGVIGAALLAMADQRGTDLAPSREAC